MIKWEKIKSTRQEQLELQSMTITITPVGKKYEWYIATDLIHHLRNSGFCATDEFAFQGVEKSLVRAKRISIYAGKVIMKKTITTLMVTAKELGEDSVFLRLNDAIEEF